MPFTELVGVSENVSLGITPAYVDNNTGNNDNVSCSESATCVIIPSVLPSEDANQLLRVVAEVPFYKVATEVEA